MEISTERPLPGFNLIGVEVNLLSQEQILDQMAYWIDTHSPGHSIVVANTHVVMERKANPELKLAIDQADLVVPDGMPLVFAGRVRGFPKTQRVDGPTLLIKALEKSNRNRWRHFFFGSTPEVLDGIQAEITRSWPGVQVSGMFSPPFHLLSTEEDETIIQQINASKSDILWIGLGCPKQEIWMFRHRDRVNVPVMIGVGMAFDILAGNKPRAPYWMQENGLEWLFRLINEPKRLWKRYLINNTQFIILATIEQIHYWWRKIGWKH
jgi:N-acetylglucosaminyldiphosphoundecaprenol N-acetyl-beta-D-mannosaminyltransferase